MHKKLLVLLLLTSSLSLQANYFARASRMFQAAKQQMINWSKNALNTNLFASELSQPMQPQRSQLASTLPTLQACAQVQPTWFSRFNMFARRFAGQRNEGGEHKQNNHDQRKQHDGYNASQFKPALGLTIFGLTLWGMPPEYEDEKKMEEILKEADDETKQKIIETICSNPTWFAKGLSPYKVLTKIFEYMPESVMPYAQSLHRSMTCGNFCELSVADFFWFLYPILEILIEKEQHVATLFIDLMLQRDALQSRNIQGILKKIIMIGSPEVVEKIENTIDELGDEDLRSMIDSAKKRKIKEKMISQDFVSLFENNCSQSSKHVEFGKSHNLEKLLNFMFYNLDQWESFKNMIEIVLTLEQQEQAAGRYTFVHGYPWHYHFMHDLYTELKYAKSGQKLDDYMFLRFITDMYDGSGSKHVSRRESLMKHGVRKYYADLNGRQKHMLFMNYALLCNQYGSNTLQYIAHNRCEVGNRLHVEKICEHLGIDYTSYKKDIEELQRLHQEANEFGAGLLLSFTPEMLKKSVYVCHGGGGKKMVDIEGIGKTDDVQLILNTLRNAPEKIKDIDHMEFVHVLTKDCALNPEVIKSGAVKIMPFNPADPEKLATYKQKMAEFIAKVKKDLAEQRMDLSADELETWQDELGLMEHYYKKYNCLNEDCSSRLQEA